MKGLHLRINRKSTEKLNLQELPPNYRNSLPSARWFPGIKKLLKVRGNTVPFPYASQKVLASSPSLLWWAVQRKYRREDNCRDQSDGANCKVDQPIKGKDCHQGGNEYRDETLPDILDFSIEKGKWLDQEGDQLLIRSFLSPFWGWIDRTEKTREEMLESSKKKDTLSFLLEITLGYNEEQYRGGGLWNFQRS